MNRDDLTVLAFFTKESADEVIDDIHRIGAINIFKFVQQAFGSNKPMELDPPEGLRFYGNNGWVAVWNKQRRLVCFGKRK